MVFMSLILRPYRVTDSHLDCGICYDSPEVTDPQDWIVHPDSGSSHPYHRICLTRWFQASNDNCPGCRQRFSSRQINCLTSLAPEGIDHSQICLEKELSALAEEALTNDLSEKQMNKIVEKALQLTVPFLDPTDLTTKLYSGLLSEDINSPFQMTDLRRKAFALRSKNLSHLRNLELELKKKWEIAGGEKLFLTAGLYKIELTFLRMRIRWEIANSLWEIKDFINRVEKNIQSLEKAASIVPRDVTERVVRAKKILGTVQKNLKLAEAAFDHKLKEEKGSFFTLISLVLLVIGLAALLFWFLF